MASVTVVVNEYNVNGRFQERYGTITMSSSYTTGGDAITAAQLGLDRVVNINLCEANNTANTAQEFDMALTTRTFQSAKVQIFGDGGNNPGGPLLEAANATNNSTITACFQAQGF